MRAVMIFLAGMYFCSITGGAKEYKEMFSDIGIGSEQIQIDFAKEAKSLSRRLKRELKHTLREVISAGNSGSTKAPNFNILKDFKPLYNTISSYDKKGFNEIVRSVRNE